jgi:hypothetical protein
LGSERKFRRIIQQITLTKDLVAWKTIRAEIERLQLKAPADPFLSSTLLLLDLLKLQDFSCSICRRSLPKPNIDHSHKTGTARGLLCFRCNFGLGWFDDNIESMIRAAEYLSSPVPFLPPKIIEP